MKFKQWFLLYENQTIAQYLKQNQGKDIVREIKKNESVKEFLSNLLNYYPIAMKKGASGVWLRDNQHIPVIVDDVREASVILRKPNNSPWEEIFHLWPVFNDPQEKTKLILPKEKAQTIVQQDPYKIFTNWFAYLFLNSEEENLDDFLTSFIATNKSQLDNWAKNYDQFKTTDVDLEGLSTLKRTGDEQQAKRNRSNKPGPEGKTFIEFPDGWKWIDLEKGYCDREGDAAGHCGNQAANEGDNIFSLRDPDNRVHMTVVVNGDGYTTEMKAPGNRKPQLYTHPYVVEFLKNNSIKGLGQGRWMIENDFKLSDLDHSAMKELAKARPDLAKFSPIEEAAIQAKGNQNQFQKTIIEKYGLSDFSYFYDYDQQALLIDKGAPQEFIDTYQLSRSSSNQYDSWSEPMEPKDFVPDLEDKGTNFGLQLFSNFWGDLNEGTKTEIWKMIDPDTPLPEKFSGARAYGYELSVKLKQAAKTNKNLSVGLSKIWRDTYTDVFQNRHNSTNRQESYMNDGFFLKLDLDRGNPVLSLYLLPQAADIQLKNEKSIVPPEILESQSFGNFGWEIQNEEPGQDWQVAFSHALQKNQFWKYQTHTDAGEDWSQELNHDDNLKNRQKQFVQSQRDLYQKGMHPMQIDSRNEHEILPNLEKKWTQGGLDEYIAELQSKGWWEPYVKWAQQNHKFIP